MNSKEFLKLEKEPIVSDNLERQERIKILNKESDNIKNLPKKYERFLELRNEILINEYLIESLPNTEERIPQLMDKNCEISVVIPSYGERDHILDTLEALSKQKNIKPEQFEVIVVINNSDKEPVKQDWDTESIYQKKVSFYKEAIKDNQDTLKLLNIILQKIEKPEINTYSSEDLLKITEIQKSGVKIHIIDKASPGKTLLSEKANVGGARNRGVAEAVARFYEQLNKNGLIVQTDADTNLDENYLSIIKEFFDNDKQLIAASAERIIFIPSKIKKEQLNIFEEAKYFRVWHYNSLLRDYIKRKTGLGLEKNVYEKKQRIWQQDTQDTPMYFCGSNMVSRAYETAIVKGIPIIPGGEDTEFGIKLSKIGKVKASPEQAKVYSTNRLSLRATTGAGATLYKIMSSIEDKTGLEKIINRKELPSEGKLKEYKKIIKPLITAIKNNKEVSKEFLQSIFESMQLPVPTKIEKINLIEYLFKNHKYELIFDEIALEIENNLSPIPFEKGFNDFVDKLIKEYAINEKDLENLIKKMSNDEDKSVERRWDYVDKLLNVSFRYKKEKMNLEKLRELLTQHKQELGELVWNILEVDGEGIIYDLLSKCVILESKESAKEFIKNQNFEELKDSSEKLTWIKLEALYYEILMNKI